MHYVLFQIDIWISKSKVPSVLKLTWKLWLIVLRLKKSNWLTEFIKQWYFGLPIPKVCMRLFKIKGATKWQDASASIDTCVLYKFSSPKSPEGGIFWLGDVVHLAISFKLYELDPSISYISVVLIHGMGVFTYPNTSVGGSGLLMYMS